jgi:uncharacterized protein with HEPN domain
MYNSLDRNFKLYLEDMLVAMSRIEEYIEGYDFIRFKQNYLIVDAVIRNFEVIGEAAKNIPDSIKNENTDVPWKKMYSLRNTISHEYFGIDYEIIWEIAANQLPNNKNQIEQIIKQLKE